MRRNRILFALPCVLLFGNILFSAETPEKRFVEVTGQGKVSAIPDQVRFTFGIENSGPGVKEVQKENARQTQALLSALKQSQIESKDIRTDLVQIQPRYDTQSGKAKYIDTVARKNFSVLIRDISSYGAVMEAVMQAGVQYVQNAQFLSSRMDALEEEARKLAALDAKRKAQVLAEALGQKVGRPLSLVENGFERPVPNFGGVRAMGVARAGVETPDQLALGEITVQGAVQARFEIEQ